MSDVEIPDHEGFVHPGFLIGQVHEILVQLNRLWLHAADSDVPDDIGALLVELAKAKKSLAEVYERAETAFITCAGEKKVEVPGVGVLEVMRKTKRTQWRHDDLRKTVIESADEQGLDPLAVYVECSSPTWRVKALREHGIDPGDYCIETPDGWSVKLPPTDYTDAPF